MSASFPPPVPLPEPLTDLILTFISDSQEVSEGGYIIFICSTRGTPPITFKLYREGTDHPLYIKTSNLNHTSYEVPVLSKEQSGKYYCEAINHANVVITSEPVFIEGESDWYSCSVGIH